ncbi:unnamed protein product [Chrysodeixis includens]|uniref:FHA domain-containing protein n=1 Tax=Chrysodeixis includens TaxID=689277 RepID=A0A9P0FQK2_CHRIL|nr:unnamed protein product [Chrysodeixis includens]
MKMTKWKLIRLTFGSEEFTFSDGDRVTVGRGNNNNISLSSAVISRNHCVINIQNNKASITDLQSSNGVYVGTTKIPPNTPYTIEDSDVIGLGWTTGAPLVNINDSEKYVFKFIEVGRKLSISSKIRYQSENELDEIESQIAKLDGPLIHTKSKKDREKLKSPVLSSRGPLKRKIEKYSSKEEPISNNNGVIYVSDSDCETQVKHDIAKKTKLEAVCEEPQKQTLKDNDNKNEDDLELEAFNVKQEYLGYDEPIQIDSESDSESEQWLLRLSQSSPGKPFIKMAKSPKTEIKNEDSSYSQLDDFVCMNSLNFEDDEDVFEEDIISIPELNKHKSDEAPVKSTADTLQQEVTNVNNEDEEEFSDDIISIADPILSHKASQLKEGQSIDEADGFSDTVQKQIEDINKSAVNENLKKAQLIEPRVHLPKGKNLATSGIKSKSSSSKHSRTEKSSSRKHDSRSLKEERKKKLKEIASKDKESEEKTNSDSLGSSKPVTNVKVTSSNRGAFLTEIAQAVIKPVKSKDTDKNSSISKENKKQETVQNLDNKNKESKNMKEKSKGSKHKDHETVNKTDVTTNISTHKEKKVSLKNLKPLKNYEESSKPVSKVEPMQVEKRKKSVRFSEMAPQVLVFQIEPGNRLKKTSLAKTYVDVRQAPIFSLEKITLMKILRWNPQWLEEQVHNNEPPPILGHNNTPLAVFHSFSSHSQYVQLIGDLLLMEIWECLTIAFSKTRNQNHGICMTVESPPPIPTQERYYDLFNISVSVSVPSPSSKNVPRVGEIFLIAFGPENAKTSRFFFVHNVRCLPSPAGNRHALYSVSLQATYTEKMRLLRPGEVMTALNLAYINKELMLFEAMAYLSESPLSEAILKPEPHHFITVEQNHLLNFQSQWTTTLNPSQLIAVSSSVCAALSDRPSIQMVQGPPGTGKSSVICAIVMSYFYDAQGKKQQNRGKILICATSNAAVDGLVIRLLNMRQSLPKQERFRMVRVGRAEAMHPKACDISSQQLATRELARIHAEQPAAPAGLEEEIQHVEAKINMWKATAQDAKDPARVSYCQKRVTELLSRMTLLRSGSGRGGSEEIRPEHLIHAERRIIEGADIIVTTLSSAQNHKMRGLKRRIALCLIDEAGQVIEPETLIPLTLDVTRLTLIGDPQQLPGYICSQRAKKHGLSESLFSRLSSCTEHWPSGGPIVLLNQQYRMHPDIADYPSRAFYGGKINTVAPRRPDLPIPTYNIINISSGDKGQGNSVLSQKILVINKYIERSLFISTGTPRQFMIKARHKPPTNI